MKYDYYKNIIEDVKQYIKENYKKEEIEELDKSKLCDDLRVEDSVTGSSSGSYTFSTSDARTFLQGNEELLVDALDIFGGDYKRALQDPEYADVIIRCYLLSEDIITKAIEKLTNEE